ncbi:hypothetical protein AAFH96_36205, partial [Polymorphospora sp. 2-325]
GPPAVPRRAGPPAGLAGASRPGPPADRNGGPGHRPRHPSPRKRTEPPMRLPTALAAAFLAAVPAGPAPPAAAADPPP